MKLLFYFELKKILNRKVNQIAMILGLLLMIICSAAQIQGETFHNAERELHGTEAVLEQKKTENALISELTEEFLTDFLQNYQRQIKDNPAGYDFALIEPNRKLFALIAKNYVEWNEYFDWETLNKINTTGGIAFYDRRIEKIETLLNADYSYGNYTQAEKDYWLQKAKSVHTPFRFGSTVSQKILWNTVGMLFYLFFVVSICIAPVFAGEYQNRTDALLLTTKYGKDKVIFAKIMASFAFVFSYITVCGLVSFSIICILSGTGDFSLPVQLWDAVIPYEWTVAKACGINLVLIFLLSFFLTAFSLLLSTISRSPMIVLAVDILLFFGTVFLPFSKSCGLWNKILYLFPLHCFDLQNVLKTYNSYQFGNIIIPYPEMIFIVYTASTLLCLLCTGKGFQKHQVKA